MNSGIRKEFLSPEAPCSLSKRYADGSIDAHQSSITEIHPLLQTHPQSHSITALHKGNLQDSFTVVPTLTPTGTMACNQRFYRNRLSETNQLLSNNEYWLRYKMDTMGNEGTIMPATGCSCRNPYEQIETQHLRIPSQAAHTVHDESHRSYPNGCYSGYEPGNRLTDEEDSAFPALHDREFHILHRNIPALRRSGVDTTTIRQHFYPDGGWGWIICSVSFLVHILTSGLQLSFSILLFYAIHHLHRSGNIEWLGALSWSISMITTPFVVTFCRKKSTRLMAVIGGLVMSLGILFTSFATEFGQVIVSYGFVFGIGVAMVRESSSIMLGNYFKKRRQFVEMVAMSGEGVGMALFSVILKEGVGKVGWRLGLQLVAVLMSINFFMGMLYRPASLYHPQRRAIEHLKNQRKKVREKKVSATPANEMQSKNLMVDISPLKSAIVKIILLTSGVASLGIYAPIFSMSINAAKEGSDIQDLVLLQTFLGMSMTLGVVVAGTMLRRPIRLGNKLLTAQVATQIFISTIAVAILFLSFVMGYRNLCILSWIYGIGFGGYRYSIKILTLERVKIKHFSKAWGLIKGAESIPILISIPLTSFLNEYSPKYGRAGYYICSAAAAIAGITIFFLSYTQPYEPNKALGNGRVSTIRSPLPPCTSAADFFHGGWGYTSPDSVHNSCINLNQVLEYPTYNSTLSTTRRLHCFGPINRQSVVDSKPIGRDSKSTRMGNRLQKSLSFIHCPCSNDGQWFCDCESGYNWKPLQRHRGLVCTCNPASQCNLSYKSRSVPEGLSSISQCSHNEIVPREPRCLPESSDPFGDTCSHCKRTYSRMNNYRQRSQSFSKPFQLVEQITTSV